MQATRPAPRVHPSPKARKRELAEGIYGARGLKGAAPLSAEDLEDLFRPLA